MTAEQVRRLLSAYDVALDAAESLHGSVRIASRPRRWTVLERLRRLPRPTIGTSVMVTHHVQRSTAALSRRFARIAATRGLTEQEERAEAFIRSFRESLPAIRWRIILAVFVVILPVAFQVTMGSVGDIATLLAFGFSIRSLNGDQLERITATVSRLTSLDLSSVTDLFNEIGKAGAAELLILLATLLGAVYLVFRPLSSAFRVKRAIFNLADSGNVDLARTTTTWNIRRSVGIYRLERELFARLGVRASHEVDIDLWTSAAGTMVITWFLLATTVDDWRGYPEGHGFDVLLFGCVAGLAGARTVWLLGCARARRRPMSSSTDAPAGVVSPFADRILEVRAPLETASLGGVFAAYWFLPSPVWVRLVRERRDLVRAHQRAWGRPLRPLGRWGGLAPAAASAVVLVLLPALPVIIHIRKLMRLQQPGVSSAKRTMLWTAPVTIAATVLLWFGFYYPPLARSAWAGAHMLALAATLSVVLGAVQREHNVIIKYIGTALPTDDPHWPARTVGVPADYVHDQLPAGVPDVMGAHSGM